MNCDQAFNALTDVSRRDHADLCEHLDRCPRCRDMAELLDPALNLFGEVIDHDSKSSPEIPAHSARDTHAAENSPATDEEFSSAPSTSRGVQYRPWLSARSRRTKPQQNGLRVAAFLMLAAIMMAAMVNVERASRSSTTIVSLPADCQRNQATDAASAQIIAGCVACHLNPESVSSLQPFQKTQATQLVKRCVSCHLELTPHQHLAEARSPTPFELPSSVQLAFCLFGRRDG